MSLEKVSVVIKEDIVRLLLARGADVNIINNRGKTPLQLAEENGHPEYARIIQSHIRKLRIAGMKVFFAPSTHA